jgi:hypothetical protein
MSRRFRQLLRSSVRRCTRRRKRQLELGGNRVAAGPAATVVAGAWDSEEGLFAGDALLVRDSLRRFQFA